MTTFYCAYPNCGCGSFDNFCAAAELPPAVNVMEQCTRCHGEARETIAGVCLKCATPVTVQENRP